MRVTTNRSALREALGAARVVCDLKAPVLAHTGVRLRADDDGFTVCGSDGTISILATVAGAIVHHAGELVMPPEALSALVDAADAKAELELSEERGDLKVSVAGKKPYKLRGLAVTFPTPLSVSLPGGDIDPAQLAGALAIVRPATGATAHVAVRSSAAGVRLAATDGYRLHVGLLDCSGFGDFDGIVGVEVLEWATKAKASRIAVDSEGKLMALVGPQTVVTARLLQPTTPFPAIDGLLTDTATVHCTCAPEAWTPALGRLAAVGVNAPVAVESDDSGQLTLSASQSEVGEGSETISVEHLDGAVAFAADRAFLADAVSVHRATMTLCFTGATQPFVLRSGQGLQAVTVVMPVKFDATS